MKKKTTGLVAVVVALALSAFTARPATETGKQSYRFAKTNAAGVSLPGPVIFIGSPAGARTSFGCPTTGLYYCGKEVDAGNADVPGGLIISRN